MKKILLSVICLSSWLLNITAYAGTAPAPSTGKARSNAMRNAHHIVGGAGFSVEIRSGEIWAWGDNNFGQLGNGTFSDSNIPVQEASHSTDWVDINAGSDHVLAVKSDGTLWAWGSNASGQLGIPLVIISSNMPMQVGNATDWVSLGCGKQQSYAIKANGTLWACGSNQSGALGINSTQSVNVFTMVGSNTNWRNVSGGNNHVAAIQLNGTLWTWGANNFGQLGNALQTSQSLAPIQIGTSNNWISVETGDDHVMALQNNGKLFAWGFNQSGQLGNGNTINQSSPVQIGSSIFWVGMASGQTGTNNVTQTLGVAADGKVYSWGNNVYGQLGNTGSNDSNPHPVPTQISTLTNIVNVECGYGSSYALGANGVLYSWGYNNKGQLGDGTNNDIYFPVTVSVVPVGWSRVAGGELFSMALKSNGTLWSWGDNSFGQLGTGSSSSSLTPVQVLGTDFTKFACGQSHSLAIKADGSLWAWGKNTNGQLGIGNTDNLIHSTPAQIGLGAKWVSVSCGDGYSMAIQANGTLWAWGDNSFGQLGNGTIGSTPETLPVQVGSLDNWVDVECGANFTLVIKADGTLWSWGNNNSGQLGLGSTASEFTTPQQVTAVSTNNWISLAVAGGGAHALGITSNGNIYSWGANNHHQLGDGTTNPHNAPIQIAYFQTSSLNGLTVYCGSFHSLAIVNNGDIYAWGENSNGQLGLGDNTFRSTPAPVLSQSKVISIGCGFNHTSLIKSDRTLVCSAGLNNAGQLGNNSTIDNNTFQCVAVVPCVSPTVPTLSSSSSAICGTGTVVLSITGGSLNDGTAWRWYSGSCGGTLIGTGNTLSVVLSATTTYYARGEGGCAAPGNCANITVTVTAPPAVNLTTTDVTNCFGGNNGAVTLTMSGGTGPYSYDWVSSISCLTASNCSFLGAGAYCQFSQCHGVTQNLSNLSAGTYSVTVTESGTGCISTASAVINQPALLVVNASASSNTVCSGGSVTLNASGAVTYSWSPTIGLSNPFVANPVATVTASTTYTVTGTDANGCTATATQTITVTTGTVAPPVITGPNAVCGLLTGIYSATSAGAVSYTWTVPSGVSITSGQGTSSIHTSFAAGTLNGNITAVALGGCGSSTPSLYLVTKKPQAPSAIAGPVSLCGNTSATYSATSFGATSYNWIVPSGLTIINGNGTSAITVSIPASFISGNIMVSAVNACGSVPGTYLTIYGHVPSTPSTVTGPVNICGLSTITYSTTAAGASSYLWTVPAGMNILSGQGTNTITVANVSFTSGNISVQGINACGSGGIKTVALTVAATTPGTISGPTVTCGITSAIYSIATVAGAVSYNWTLPSGAIVSLGQGTTSIIASFTTPMIGNVSVTAYNGCANSTARTLAVNKVPATPGPITGTSVVCSLGTFNYSIAPVSGATSYLWVVPAGITLVSGQGTTAITVNVASTPIAGGQIKVYAQTTCGNSALQAKTIGACAAPNLKGSGNEEDKNIFSAIYPNPANSSFTIDLVSNRDRVVVEEIFDILGNIVLNRTVSIAAGTTSIKTNIDILTKGMYFVRLVDADKSVIYTSRVIKE